MLLQCYPLVVKTPKSA